MAEPPKPGQVVFFPLTNPEYQYTQQYGVRPKHLTYLCGACGNSTNGRAVCQMDRLKDRAVIMWCMCSCDKQEPSLVLAHEGEMKIIPQANEFHASGDWPAQIGQLYEEASKAFSAGAFTASSMVCRKILMNCAHEKGAGEGKNFQEYVKFIIETVLPFEPARTSIDAIRKIGNEANHEVDFVNQADARRSLKIVTYMLTTIYSLPLA